jgi:hypothetical protein
LQQLAVLAPPDTQNRDQFGADVAVYQTLIAATAPGYNSDQGAAYVFSCSTTCTQRQKLLAADGEPDDRFGDAVDLYGGLLVVGAPEADPARGDWNEPTSETNPLAKGAAYVFVPSAGVWVEQQRLRPTTSESYKYWRFGGAVAISDEEVLVRSAGGLEAWESALVFVYPRRGGALVTTHQLAVIDHGDFNMSVSHRTAVVGFPYDATYTGYANTYVLPR